MRGLRLAKNLKFALMGVVLSRAIHDGFTELRTLELMPVDVRHRENFNMRCYQNLPIRLAA